MKHISKLIPTAAALLMLLSLSSCGTPDTSDLTSDAPQQSASETEQAASLDLNSLPSITLTSENLHGGVWDDDISNTNKGSNRSPQLSWQPVEGAACYAVYMVDTSVTYWLHWKNVNVTATDLPAGSASENEYVGPYPPSGTHDYEIRIYALKEAVSEDRSKFDNSNAGFDEMVAALDKSSSGSGNILAYGTLTGTFTRS